MNNKVIIFYYSGTGNTWYASNYMAKKFIENNYDTKAISIESVSVEQANQLILETDIIIFGYPVYASYVPQPMVNFINKLAAVNQKSAAVYCTQMIFSGDGAKMGANILTSKGFCVKWAKHISMPNNLNCGMFGFLPITNDTNRLNKKLAKANKNLNRFIDEILSGKPHLNGSSKVAYALGRTQHPKNIEKANNKWKTCMSINTEECIVCGLCAEICPMNNIKKSDNKYQTYGDCCGCLRCHNYCPQKAVMFKGKKSTKDSYRGPTKDFNVRILKSRDEKL